MHSFVRRLGILILVALAVAAVASAQTFQRSDWPAGGTPVQALVGDFNGDLLPDIATYNTSTTSSTAASSISVLLSLNGLSFGTPVVTGLGTGQGAIAAGDFNNDGKLDLAVAQTANNQVVVLLGNGDGTFQAPRSFATGTAPDSIVVADFNRDGKLDIATANNTANSLSILLGNGDGSFQARHDIDAGPRPSSLVTGDFNGDNIADLAYFNCCDSASFLVELVPVLLGNGDGTFRAVTPLQQTGPNFLGVGALNADTFADFAVSFNGCHTPCSGLTTAVSNGSGSFTSATQLANNLVYGRIGNPVIADFNADSLGDVAYATTKGTGNPQFGGPPEINVVSLWLGIGGGNLAGAPLDFEVGGTAWTVTADFNKDGRPDIVTANGAAGNITLLSNSTGGAPLPATPTPPPTPTPTPTPVPTFALAATPDSRTVSRGQPAQFNVTVAAQGGAFTGAVALSCSGLPAGAACNFSPAAVTPGSSTAASTLTITTTAATASVLPRRWMILNATIEAMMLPFAAVFVAGIPARHRAVRWTLLALALAATLLLVACNGMSNNTTSTPGPTPTQATPSVGTPVGTHTIVVTGTSGNTQKTANVTLVVQ